MSRAATSTEPSTDTPTHLLIWFPQSLLKGSGEEECWVFMTYHDARTGADQPFPMDGPCFPKDAHPDDLHSWVEAKLGHPVVLVADTERINRRWHLRLVKCPVYWVYQP